MLITQNHTMLHNMIAKLPKGIRMIKPSSIQNYNTLTTQTTIQMLQNMLDMPKRGNRQLSTKPSDIDTTSHK